MIIENREFPKGKVLEDWNYEGIYVVYDFNDGSTIVLARELFIQEIRETDMYSNQVDVDEFESYIPTDKQFKEDEHKFFNNYFKDLLAD
jgi:hypothetical protein